MKSTFLFLLVVFLVTPSTAQTISGIGKYKIGSTFASIEAAEATPSPIHKIIIYEDSNVYTVVDNQYLDDRGLINQNFEAFFFKDTLYKISTYSPELELITAFKEKHKPVSATNKTGKTEIIWITGSVKAYYLREYIPISKDYDIRFFIEDEQIGQRAAAYEKEAKKKHEANTIKRVKSKI